ncbi:PREDICTED: serine/threonine-protein kinase Nek8 [Nicrophorus vespilloides]|uniref:non-specific serine/threonine protein kinase n=1 Tax=Nicrophorus vespilloides TaxID=110193 RepID=A0ABM1MCK7_NICVS|nr:PREDICTED: serine/threonine-protein kinase Nek8 [Nicrophorus vespilloides]
MSFGGKSSQELRGYEKIKTVGKGSFGTATLYKRLEDEVFVVMKEVFVSDMSPIEKSAALNEVEVLSSLDHPNIIKYLGSFQHGGSLMIVMEYADGGNLAQLISRKQEKREKIPEPEILDIFEQICCGISYMHANKILHRDMKSANVFLNKDGTVKIGDFGISKMMNTRSQAHTVVGTPYYLSPEMCEGKDYNEKSDVWAMGCILYELVCLRRPFEAPTLPLLIQKISSCDFPRIPNTYSDGIFQLIEMILQRDSEKRPSGLLMLHTIIPAIREELKSLSARLSESLSLSPPKERSVLYDLQGFTSNANLHPTDLPSNLKLIDVAQSFTHSLVISDDFKVFSWGEDAHGQQGLGMREAFRRTPIANKSLQSYKVIRCCAGLNFTIFLTEDGTLLSCGNGKFGCLGHGNWSDQLTPKFIESLKNMKISEICSGANHVLALATNGKVFAWGSAQHGQLGLGHTQYCCKPMPLKLSDFNVQKVFGGEDCSALLTTSGKIYFAGSNTYSKLGFKQAQLLKTFWLFEGIKERFMDVSFGKKHTVLLGTTGNVYCLGSSEHGQCGKSETRLILNKVERISAGPTYTVASTYENVVYFWGSYSKRSKNVDCNLHLFQNDIYEKSQKTIQLEDSPKPILALYASAEKIKNGNILWIGGLVANANSVSVLVHTTTPTQKKHDEDVEDDCSRVLNTNWTSSNQTLATGIALMNTPFQ